MVLILLVYISISFCSNFLYAQICRVGVEMHSRQSSHISQLSDVLIIKYYQSRGCLLLRAARRPDILFHCWAVPSDLPSQRQARTG